MVDPILNSLKLHYKNCMVDSKENYRFDLGVKGWTDLQQLHPHYCELLNSERATLGLHTDEELQPLSLFHFHQPVEANSTDT